MEITTIKKGYKICNTNWPKTFGNICELIIQQSQKLKVYAYANSFKSFTISNFNQQQISIQLLKPSVKFENSFRKFFINNNHNKSYSV